MPPTPLRVAIVVFDGFSELDTFVTFGLLNRLSAAGWKADEYAYRVGRLAQPHRGGSQGRGG